MFINFINICLYAMTVNYISTSYAIIRLRAICLIKWFALYMALIWSVPYNDTKRGQALICLYI